MPDLTIVSRFQSSRSLRTATAWHFNNLYERRYFNPRGPCGPRPFDWFCPVKKFTISILAVLADRDACCSAAMPTAAHFNPRGPCGPRPTLFPSGLMRLSYFNPRGPCGPRHGQCKEKQKPFDISILAVLADRDSKEQDRGGVYGFQSSRSLRTATGL